MAAILRIKYRQDWGAREPAWEETLNREPATKVFLHHHANLYGWRNNFQNEVMKIMQLTQDRNIDHYGLSDLAYHFYVAADGYVYEGRHLKYNTPDRLAFNPQCYGNRIDICYLGDYLEQENTKPREKMIRAAIQVMEHCVKIGKLHKLFSYTRVYDKLEKYYKRIDV